MASVSFSNIQKVYMLESEGAIYKNLTPVEVSSPVFPNMSKFGSDDTLGHFWNGSTVCFEATACQHKSYPIEAKILKIDDKNFKVFLVNPIDFMDEAARASIADSIEVLHSSDYALDLKEYVSPGATFDIIEISQHDNQWGRSLGKAIYK